MVEGDIHFWKYRKMDTVKYLQTLKWPCRCYKNNTDRLRRLDIQGKAFIYFYNSLTKLKN